MGSKYALLPWIAEVLTEYQFDSAIDAFAGSGAVAYLLKGMGKRVLANDFLALGETFAHALIQNDGVQVDEELVADLVRYDPRAKQFIQRTFDGIFFSPADLRFLDRVWWNLRRLSPSDPRRSLVLAALARSCMKRQPRGVFTVAGDPERYKDGRRDLKLSLSEHFLEQIDVFNAAAFSNGQRNVAQRGDVFEIDPTGYDLAYLDPPYVPRSDDNCYIKRYHFVEGLMTYWEGHDVMADSRVKKLRKRYTPFSYRRDAVEAFRRLFAQFKEQTIVLSYSSNGFPDLAQIRELLAEFKSDVRVESRKHRYHFGTHGAVQRSSVDEYLIIGSD